MPINASGLSDAQLAQLKKMLEDKMSSIRAEVRELEAVLTEKDSEDKAAPDEVDRSSFEEEMQRTQLVLDGKKQLEHELFEALRRVTDGSYGVCEESEEPIGFKRLQAQPWTRLSLEAQQDLEDRRKSRAGGTSAHLGGYGASSKFDDSESSDD